MFTSHSLGYVYEFWSYFLYVLLYKQKHVPFGRKNLSFNVMKKFNIQKRLQSDKLFFEYLKFHTEKK